MQRREIARANRPETEMFAGVHRATLGYDEQLMMCRIRLERGATVPMHHHAATQCGYVVDGRVRLTRGEDGMDTFEVTSGDSYLFSANEPHSAEALEYSTVIETFAPYRAEYTDE